MHLLVILTTVLFTPRDVFIVNYPFRLLLWDLETFDKFRDVFC